MNNDSNVNELVGKVLASVTMNPEKDEVVFTTRDGHVYQMFHDQDCCESVFVEDIQGSLDDLVGVPILSAEESSNNEDPKKDNDWDNSHTWTFYRFQTIKGNVVIRWYGTSNGYYSESVSFERVK